MRVTLLALLVACAGSDDVHELDDCGAWPALAQDPPARCESACRDQPGNFEGSGQEMPCVGRRFEPTFDRQQCPRSSELDGVRGCCAPRDVDGETHVQFFSCE